MLDILPVRLLPIRSTLGKEHLSADLARFSLDPSLAGVDLCHHGPTAPYPSPPMSGSPPLSDLPESQQEDHRQAREPRRSSGNARQENVPRTDPETGQRGSSPTQQRQPPWTTTRPPPSSPSLFQGLSAPVVLGLRSDPRSTQGEHILLPTTSSQQTSTFHQQRVSPRSPRTPRPPKTHVASACVNCRTAHLACDGKHKFHFLLAFSFKFESPMNRSKIHQKKKKTNFPFHSGAVVPDLTVVSCRSCSQLLIVCSFSHELYDAFCTECLPSTSNQLSYSI